ncbi:LysM peptidoglycan-binding domain-containing protein [Candidatus Saccharibacteria bacterium]|nr:LysM peptidoglycan-binding domain-containing protein [Candidatus Saccharibacteria bacterium]
MAAHKKQRKRIQNTFGIAFDQYDCHKGPARSNDISSKQPGSSVTRQLQRRRQLASNRLQRTLRRKAVKKRLIRFGLVSANTLVLIGVMFFVITSGRVDRPETVAAQKTAEVATTPVDKLTSFDVAANVAKAVDLPEKTPITNQAQSAKVAVIVSASDAAVTAKPQVVSTGLKSWRDITEHTVVSGETVSVIAQKFGVTSESIRWSNGLSGDALTAGSKLVIPPVNGVVYTVKTNDTPQTVAAAYHSAADKIIQYNDAENGLVVGRRIIIPDGRIVPATPARTTTYITNRTVISTSSFTPSYGANGYDWGWCTYYAAARSGAPGNWGNANTWAYYARISGWTVSSTPVAGAIFQTPAGWAGHVGIVDEVYGNGTMKVSDMNGFAGFGRVGSAVVPITQYPNYIYR